MADEAHMPVAERGPRKRKANMKKGSKGKKKLKGMPDRSVEKVKINNKMRKLFRKRARDYNSDDDDEEGDGEESTPEFRGDVSRSVKKDMGKEEGGDSSDAEGEEGEGFSDDDEENGEIQPGIADFAEGSRVFKMAFKSILKSSVADDALGPVLSAHKKLVVEKLAEEEAERKVKGEAKKEKHLLAEKGHVKPANYLDSHEKFLIGVATKGVVKLFNAVNKAQNAQKGLNPSRSKDAKVLNKRRKETFFSELGKASVSTDASSKGDGPAWAPLRDNYMLTNSKLKDWDKLPEDSTVGDETGRLSEEDGSSDDD